MHYTWGVGYPKIGIQVSKLVQGFARKLHDFSPFLWFPSSIALFLIYEIEFEFFMHLICIWIHDSVSFESFDIFIFYILYFCFFIYFQNIFYILHFTGLLHRMIVAQRLLFVTIIIMDFGNCQLQFSISNFEFLNLIIHFYFVFYKYNCHSLHTKSSPRNQCKVLHHNILGVLAIAGTQIMNQLKLAVNYNDDPNSRQPHAKIIFPVPIYHRAIRIWIFVSGFLCTLMHIICISCNKCILYAFRMHFTCIIYPFSCILSNNCSSIIVVIHYNLLLIMMIIQVCTHYGNGYFVTTWWSRVYCGFDTLAPMIVMFYFGVHYYHYVSIHWLMYGNQFNGIVYVNTWYLQC